MEMKSLFCSSAVRTPNNEMLSSYVPTYPNDGVNVQPGPAFASGAFDAPTRSCADNPAAAESESVSATALRVWRVMSHLADDHRVAGADEDGLRRVVVQRVLVVEADRLDTGPVRAQDPHVLGIREFLEAARHRQDLDDGGRPVNLHRTRMRHLAHDEHLRRQRLNDDDRDGGIRH